MLIYSTKKVDMKQWYVSHNTLDLNVVETTSGPLLISAVPTRYFQLDFDLVV